MSVGPKQVFTCNTASGASTSSFIDLGDRSWKALAVNAVSMSTNAAITVYGAVASGTSFSPIYVRLASAATQYAALAIATSTSSGWAVFDAPPFQYIQFITSAVVSGGVSYTVIAQDN